MRPGHPGFRPVNRDLTVLDAEGRRIAPVPAGLINGTAYRGGMRPPLEPSRAIAALRYLLDHPGAPDSDILAIAGPPWSVSGCTVSGDLDGLAAGNQVMLRQTGQISVTGNAIPESQPIPEPTGGGAGPISVAGVSSGPAPRYLARAHLVIESLPPGSSPNQVARDLVDQAKMQPRAAGDAEFRSNDALPIAEVSDCGTSAMPVRIAIALIAGTNPLAARDQLAAFAGITAEAPAAYPAPLATLLRAWTDQHRSEDIAASLAGFEDAIRRDREDIEM